jgi:hypothetical protein
MARMNWIKVDDRLPKMFETVLIYDKNKVKPAFLESSATEENVWFLLEERSWAYENATHWMELPEPPK